MVFEDKIKLGSRCRKHCRGRPAISEPSTSIRGNSRWSFHTIPHPGEFGYDTWPKDAYKTPRWCDAWSGLSVDPQLGMVFAATGSPRLTSTEPIASVTICSRIALLALDARTGKRIWHFQDVKHDVWDLISRQRPAW